MLVAKSGGLDKSEKMQEAQITFRVLLCNLVFFTVHIEVDIHILCFLGKTDTIHQPSIVIHDVMERNKLAENRRKYHHEVKVVVDIHMQGFNARDSVQCQEKEITWDPDHQLINKDK